MSTESGPQISEELFVELVDCTPEPEAAANVSTAATAVDVATPQARAAAATIEQTGADPPPEGL